MCLTAASARLPSFAGEPAGAAGAMGRALTGSGTETASPTSAELASPSLGSGSTKYGWPRLLFRRRGAGGRYFRGKSVVVPSLVVCVQLYPDAPYGAIQLTAF